MKKSYYKAMLLIPTATYLIASAALPGVAIAASTTPSAINLASASTFGLLATSITNDNPVYVTGNVGSGIAGQTSSPIISPGGNDYLMGPIYNAAIADLGSAIVTAQNEQATSTESVPAIGGSVLSPGVYYFAGAAYLNSSITLSGNGIYVFQVSGTLNTASNVIVNLTNGAQASNVFWVVTGATTLAANTQFAGTIMSNAAITVGANSNVQGRILSTTAATVSTDTISAPFSEQPTTLPQATVGAGYAQSLDPYTSNGLLPLSWSITALDTAPLSVVGSVYSGATPTNSSVVGYVYGTTPSVTDNVYGQSVSQNVYQLPDGLMLWGNGTFTGTPNAAGTISFNANATDATGQTASSPNGAPFTLTITPNETSLPVTPSVTPTIATATGSVLPTILSQSDVSAVGGTVTAQSGNAVVTVTVPNGAFTGTTQVTLTTGTASAITKGFPTGQTFVNAYGMYFTSGTPNQSVSLSLKDIAIPRSALVYQIASDGSLQALPAKVEAGSVTVSVSSNADIVIANPNLSGTQRQILWNGEQEQVANGFVAKDPLSGTPTTYLPIWYAMQILHQHGITSTWNGNSWNLTTAGKVDLTNTSPNSVGNMQIMINGTLVENVTGQIAKDPLHGNMTSYMPIYWVFKALSRIGINSSWNGVTWDMTN